MKMSAALAGLVLGLLLPGAASAAPAADDLPAAAEQLRGSCARSLLPGLRSSQAAITLREYDVIAKLAKDPRVKSVLYLNRFGEVRWAAQADLWTMSFEQLIKRSPLPTDAVARALTSSRVVVVPAPGGAVEAAMPLESDGKIQGVLDILADVRGLRSLGADARRRLKRDAPIRAAAARLKPSLNPENERMALQHYLAGLIFFHKGEQAKARDEWTLAAQLDPGNPELPAALKRVKAK